MHQCLQCSAYWLSTVIEGRQPLAAPAPASPRCAVFPGAATGTTGKAVRLPSPRRKGSALTQVCSDAQGLLRLDAPYEPPERRSPALPFCKHFSACTCCNASHAAALAREVGAALADDSLSAGCKAVVAQLACRCGFVWGFIWRVWGQCVSACAGTDLFVLTCLYSNTMHAALHWPSSNLRNGRATEADQAQGRAHTVSKAALVQGRPASCRKGKLQNRRVCDPLVGTGLRPTVCLELCNTWLASCRDDYFEWYREELLPCRYGPPALCMHLHEHNLVRSLSASITECVHTPAVRWSAPVYRFRRAMTACAYATVCPCQGLCRVLEAGCAGADGRRALRVRWLGGGCQCLL